MKISDKGVDFITKWEGIRLEVYKDAAGLDTIGIGHLIKPGEDFSQGITYEQAINLLKSDVAPVEAALADHVDVTLTQNQFDALASWIFNVGIGAFISSTLLKWLNAGRYDDIPMQLTRWNKAGGKSLRGLAMRRVAEAAVFLD